MSSADHQESLWATRYSPQRWPQRYGLALGAVSVATILQYGVDISFGFTPPFLFLYPTVTIIALLAGFGPGLCATLLSAMTAVYFFLEPLNSFAISHRRDLIGLILFTVMGTAISGVSDQFRTRAKRLREFEKVVEGLEEMIVVLDRDYRYVIANHAFLNYRGIKSEDLIGRHISEVLNPGTFERIVKDKLDECFRGKTVQYEMQYKYPEKGYRDIFISYFPIEGPGEVDRVACILHDITERKRAESALRSSEQRYRTLFEKNVAGVATLDIDGFVMECNDAWAHLFGYDSAADCRGHQVTESYAEPSDRERLLGELIQNGSFSNRELQMRRQDGTLIWVLLSSTLLLAGQNEPLIQSAVIDITPRKQAEEVLREQAEAMNSAQVFVRDMQSRIVFWPRGAEKIYGFSADEAVGAVSHDLLRTQFPDPLEVIQKKLIETGRWEGELIQRARNGDTIVVTSSWILHRNSQGTPVRILETNIDVTAHKRAQEELDRYRHALEDKTLLLQSVLDSMSEGLVVADEKGNFVIWNPAADKIVGRGPSNMPSQQWTQHYGIYLGDKVTPFPPELNPLARAIQGDTGSAVMYLRHPAANEGVFIEAYASPLKDKRGVVRGGVAAFRDISERMKTVERLEEYERVVEGLEEMILVVDRKYRYVIANLAFLTFRGMSAEQLVGHTVEEVVGEDAFKTQIKEKMDECFLGKSVQYELTYDFPSVGKRDLSASYFPIMGQNGVERIACILQDITERKLSEKALRNSEERFSKAFRSNPLAITISTEQDGRYLDVNDAFLELLRYQRKDVIGRTSKDLGFWNDPDDRIEMFRQLRDKKHLSKYNAKYRTSKGEVREAELWVELIELEGQSCLLAITRDITETQQLEAQFRQAQKMEAVGRLAGGIAHDFNNLLGVITGYADISLGLLTPENPVTRYVGEAKKAAQRAASLTQQLLAFSRKQVVFPKILDLNEIVRNALKMFLRLVGEDIAVEFQPMIPLGSIRADSGQIEQVLMNLVVNARDAMPTGGKILIQTTNAEVDEHYLAQHAGAHIGQHVVLVVSDTGSGMDENTKSQIFEPFFTTKDVGKGTGLGLATVYGIVKQSNGYIAVYSEPGRGSTFKIYFPVVGGASQELVPTLDLDPPRGTETVLVVEDEQSLREVTVALLQGAGYRVLQARDAEEALAILGGPDPTIDLLLTDVVMPGKSGAELAREGKDLRPKLRSLFTSGYTGDLVSRQGVPKDEELFIEKPFTKKLLLSKVYSVLHSGPLS